MDKIRYSMQEECLRSALRDRRKALRMKQGELARKMGKARNFVSKCEHGERRLSFPEVLEACHWLGLHEQDLIDAIRSCGAGKGMACNMMRRAMAEMPDAAESGGSGFSPGGLRQP